MSAFLSAVFLVVIAEMGDKTQLLAMAMASKYKWQHVMLGVFFATILNHGLAVALGSYISSFVSMETIQLVAGIAFLVFGLWTIHGDKLDDEDNKPAKFGPIVTVAIAFFLAEMGDKTQLMTITISAQYQSPFLILMGTTVGMLIADAIGILGGAWMAKHIPPSYVKWIAGSIFIFFGTLTVYQSAPIWLLSPLAISIYVLALLCSIYLIGIHPLEQEKNAKPLQLEVRDEE